MPLKHALITGGSRGIGLSIAQLLARNNYACTLVSRSTSSLESAVSTLSVPSSSTSTQTSASDTQSPHAILPGDISLPSFWTHDTFAGVKKRTPRFDVLVNCAGISQSKLFSRTSEDEIQEIVNTNLTGTMLGTRYLLRNRYLHSSSAGGLRKNSAETNKERHNEAEKGVKEEEEEKKHSSVIINVASLMGVSGGFGAVAYAASKAGVLGFTRALATELGANGGGIRVNAILPGYVETEMTKGERSLVSFLLLASAFCGNENDSKPPRESPNAEPYVSLTATSTDLDHTALLRKIPLGRFAQADEIASAALFLAQNEYAHNCVINLDGGISAV